MVESRIPSADSGGSASDELTELHTDEPPSLGETQTFDAQSSFPNIDGYKILDVLGRGGMGVVYKASDLKLKRYVALKMVLIGEHASAEQLARFRVEAETVARLRHPNIVQIFDVGEYRGQPFLTFELVEGVSLARFAAGIPQPPEIAAELIEIAARAVHYAHEKSVVHRDLKPGNILIEQTAGVPGAQAESNLSTSDARRSSTKSTSNLSAMRTTSGGLVPKISDFGLAKQLDADDEQTTTGQVLGTARYMAPEQAVGQKVGPAADVYSLGTILYELLVGRTPFHGASVVETLQMLRHDEPIPIRRLQPRLPRDLETICMKCLEKAPPQRYTTAESLADDLRGFLKGEPISARPVGPLERSLKWARRRPAVAALISMLLVVTGLAFAGVTWQWRKTLAAQRRGAETQVDLLLHARPEAVPAVVSNLAPYRAWVDPALRQLLNQPDLSIHDRDRVNLGLLPVDPSRVDYLTNRLNSADEPLDLVDFLTVRDALFPFRSRVIEGQWKLLHDDKVAAETRLRTAVVLAHFDPVSQGASEDRWSQVASLVARQLSNQADLHPNQHAALAQSLYPIRTMLLPSLVEQLRNEESPASLKSTIASIVADYAHDAPAVLVELAVESDSHQHAILLPKLANHRLEAVGLLRDILDEDVAPDLPEAEKDDRASRQAIAAMTLAHLDRADLLWRSMRYHDEPRLRTYLIHRIAAYAISIETLAQRLEQETDASLRRVILLSLGEYDVRELDSAFVTEITSSLVEAYQVDPDCGVHSAIEWLLDSWGLSGMLDRVQAISTHGLSERNWYRNSEGHVLALIKGPITFRMGSPDDEPGRRGEQTHWRRLGRILCNRHTRGHAGPVRKVFTKQNPPLKHSQDKRYGPDPDGTRNWCVLAPCRDVLPLAK